MSTPAPTSGQRGQEEDHAMEELKSKLTLSWFVVSVAIKKPPAQLVVQPRACSKAHACVRAGAARDHSCFLKLSAKERGLS